MKKIAAAVLALGLLPLAGCATPHGYSRYDSGPYAAYDPNYNQGYQGYEPSAPYYGESYGQPGYGPDSAYAGTYGQGYSGQAYYGAGYSAPAYSGQAYPSQSCCGASYGASYGAGYSQSGYASSYYSAPPPPMRYGPPAQPSSYYNTYYRCGC
jgi:hypothetical protein